MRLGWGGVGLMAAGLSAVVLALAIGAAPKTPDWAFPPLSRGKPLATPRSTVRNLRLPGSNQAFSDAELHDVQHAVDWRPQTHGPAPAIVMSGRGPPVWACGYCHMPAGTGRPENAVLAGLPADYIERQVADMRAGVRRSAGGVHWGPGGLMSQMARGVSPADLHAAAIYFSQQRFTPRIRVVEAAVVPRAAGVAAVYRFDRSGATQRLGQRILEGPDDFERFEMRDDQMTYTAYAPPGAIARGRSLATTGDAGRTQPCAACHGERLQGALGPPLAGHSPTGLFRQLYGFKTGVRHGEAGAPMRQVVARLSLSDMIDLAAYAASLR